MGRVVEPAVTDPQSDASLSALISLASASAGWTERDASYLVDKIEQLEAAQTWTRRLAGEPKSWERFCREVLGYEAGYVEKVREGVAILKAAGVADPIVRHAHAAAVQQMACNPKTLLDDGPATIEEKIIFDYIKDNPGGTSAEYLVARIKAKRPDILDRMKAGEFKSVRAAAMEAGIVKERVTFLKQPEAAAAAIKRHFSAAEVALIKELL